MEKWLTVAEACQALDISERTLRRRLKEGKFETKRDGRCSYILVEAPEHSPAIGSQMPAINEQLVQQIQSENKYLRSELTATRQTLADIQAELAEASQRAEESSKRSDTIILQMTQQLERANLQIEDFTRNQTVWQRVKAIFTSQPA